MLAGNVRAEEVIERSEDSFDDATQYLNEPVRYRRFIRRTNSLERLNARRT